MVATIHVGVHIMVPLHITMLAIRGTLGLMHIAERSLQRLRCKEYKKGQKYVFHNSI